MSLRTNMETGNLLQNKHDIVTLCPPQGVAVKLTQVTNSAQRGEIKLSCL